MILLQDLRYALRVLRSNPGFVTTAVLTLVLGVGANATIFTLIDSLLLRKLPVSEPERLVAISTMSREGESAGLSYAMFRELKSHQQVFSSLAAFSGDSLVNVEANGTLSTASAMAVTGNFFAALDVSADLGRTITSQDFASGEESPSQVAMISYNYWQQNYSSDPAAIGKSIRIQGIPFTIVGVTRRDFFGLHVGFSQDLIYPLGASGKTLLMPDILALDVIGRLRNRVTLDQAGSELNTLWQGIKQTTIPDNLSAQEKQDLLSRRLLVTSAATGFTRLRQVYSEPLLKLMGLVGLILLIACANLACLMLARAAARRHEIAIRISMGATRWRLARQMLTETALLSGVGAVIALPLAYWSSRLLVHFIWTAPTLPNVNLNPDSRILGLTAAISIFTGMLFGLPPIWHATHQIPSGDLQQRSDMPGGGPGWFVKLLVVTQISLSLAALVGATLLSRSLDKLRSLDLGFHSDGVLIANLMVQPGGHEHGGALAYYRELLETISQESGVRSDALSNLMPIFPLPFEFTEVISTKSSSSGTATSITAQLHIVSPGFFETMGIPIAQGRDFDFHDDENAPRVVIVSESLAKRISPAGQALGQEISIGTKPEHQHLRIIGIARNARLFNIRTNEPLAAYLSFFQEGGMSPVIEVRTVSDPRPLARSIRQRIVSLGREQPFRLALLTKEIDQSILKERMLAMLSSFFGALALLLAAVGLWGVTSYTVARRTYEIGIRIAFGAQRGEILWMVWRDSFLLLGLGLLLGIPIAIAGAHVISSQLFGLGSTDLYSFALAAAVLVLATALAGWIPAKFAGEVDPMVILRYQ